MIVFSLRCGQDHTFEAWFRDNATFDAQAASREVACPVCGDTAVQKAPMAPAISRSNATRSNAEDDRAQKLRALAVEARRQMTALRQHVEQTCEPVGDRFAEEARRIHYGETEQRDIYGSATPDEAESLVDEGIPFGRIPWPATTDS